MAHPSDGQVVLFVDMLGFASLVEQTPDAVAKLEPIFQPLTPTKVVFRTHRLSDETELVERFTNFHVALEKRIRAKVNKGITAITFSDSAFVHIPNAMAAIPFARELMRDLVKKRVPVRMGLGCGSFAALRFFSDSTPSARIHTTQFLGTAVVRAHAAEQSGFAGLQILLHPSMKAIVQRHDHRSSLLLKEPNPKAFAEVNYLFINDKNPKKSGSDAVRNRYDLYKDHVDMMRDEAPIEKRVYYSNTVAAYVRMREYLRAHRMEP